MESEPENDIESEDEDLPVFSKSVNRVFISFFSSILS
jgi:hypothetical protein